MRRARAAVIGAAETTEMGKLPHMSQLQLHADAALNALADAVAHQVVHRGHHNPPTLGHRDRLCSIAELPPLARRAVAHGRTDRGSVGMRRPF